MLFSVRHFVIYLFDSFLLSHMSFSARISATVVLMLVFRVDDGALYTPITLSLPRLPIHRTTIRLNWRARAEQTPSSPPSKG